MRKKAWFFICAALVLAGWNVVVAQQDQVTITTYFPSPNGVFSYVRMNRGAASSALGFSASASLVWGANTSMGALTSDQGASMEIGDNNGASRPYIIFNKGAINSTIQLHDDNILHIYVWGMGGGGPSFNGSGAMFNVLNHTGVGRKDLFVRRIHYHWGWMNGTIEKDNLPLIPLP